MKSLRRSILLWMAALLLAVGVLSAFGTYFYVKGEATGAVDTQLKQIAQFVSSTNTTRSTSDNSVDVANPEDLFLIEVWDQQKNLLRSSDKLNSLAPPLVTGFTDQNIKGQRWRSYSFVGGLNLVRVSLPADVSDEQASNAAFQVALPAALVIPLSWLLLSFIIDRIFAPLDIATARLRSGQRADDMPVTESEFPREVAPFIGAINELVSRLHTNVEQQKQFVSNAAHELRTPLTAISLQIGNLSKFAKSVEFKQRVHALEAGSQRANHLVNKLLKLAQIDSDQMRPNAEKSDFSEIIARSMIDLASLAQHHSIAVSFNQSAMGKILVPSSEARSIADVLIENAIVYSNDGSEVELTLTGDAHAFKLDVKDHGIGIPEDKLAQVFDRFYRAAPEYAEGSGLGLAIAQTAAERLGWKIVLTNRSDRTGIIASAFNTNS
jgi:two-component system OmpR family sensor kinase